MTEQVDYIDTGCPPAAGRFVNFIRSIGREYGPPPLYRLYAAVHAAIPQTKNGGIVGDRAHTYGYHRCRAVLPSNDYSVVERRDKSGDRWAASGLDITFTSQAAMHAACKRLMAACLAGDSRLSALREWFGTIDGTHVTGYSLLRKRKVTSDRSHLWHIHLSIYRDVNGSDTLMQAIAAVIVGTPPKPLPSVDLSLLVQAAKTDPERPQGGTTPGAEPSVRLVEGALRAEGLLDKQYASDGSYGELTVAAYAAWQRRCGYQGKDADGIPGAESLKSLGAKRGFQVVA